MWLYYSKCAICFSINEIFNSQQVTWLMKIVGIYYRDLMEELAIYIRDAIDKKQENMRRRRRRDALRLQLVKVFEMIAAHGTFGVR